MPGAYYNEIDPYCAQWLRNLIAAGHIAAGEVDERSIEDVRPDDLRGFTQCHFFAGIGVWSSALRLAGWPDDRPVWTGSCPCQPFSQAGKGAGFADERHLWPAWHHLISQCRPSVIFGEQVASKDVDPWIDLVFDDLEAMEYACAANPFPSAGVGAPHIRDRTFFVAHAADQRLNRGRSSGARNGRNAARIELERFRNAGRLAYADGRDAGAEGVQRSGQHGQQPQDGRTSQLADADGRQLNGLTVIRGTECDGADAGRPKGSGEPESRGDVCGVADADDTKRQTFGVKQGRRSEIAPQSSGLGCFGVPGGLHDTGPTNGFWRAADWLLCRDGKWRPVEPGTFPLAHGAPARVGRLRAYGNAINREAAAAFIEAAREALTI